MTGGLLGVEQLKLGKTPAAPRPKDFKWGDFNADVSLPSHPPNFGHALMHAEWGMLGNGPDDTVHPGFGGAGCCVWSGAANEHRVATKIASGVEAPFTGKEVIGDYSAQTGYDLATGANDNGTDMGEAAEYRRNVGILDANGDRHTIAAWVRLDPKNWEHFIEATYIFLFAGMGFEFPASAWDQFAAGEPWDYDRNANNSIEGGHYIARLGSKRNVTWGRPIIVTKSFYEEFNDETIAYVTHEQLRANAKDVHGFDLEKLQSFLDALKQ